MTAIILRRRVIRHSSRFAAQRAAKRWLRDNGARTRLIADYGCAVRAFLVASHDELSATQQADVLAAPLRRVRHWRHQLYAAGVLVRGDAATFAPFDDERHGAAIRRLLAEGYHPTYVANLRNMRHSHKVYELAANVTVPAERRTWSMKEVAALFDVSVNTMWCWTGHGFLPDYRLSPKHHWFWWSSDLQAFIENRTTWLYWEPAQLTDAAWRRRAETARANAGGRWLSLQELAAWWHLSDEALQSFTLRGGMAGLPTYRAHARYWWVTPEDEATLQTMAAMTSRQRRKLARAMWPGEVTP
jgi:hypothetical protein